jgi:superfamily II DNA helicase RecQ
MSDLDMSSSDSSIGQDSSDQDSVSVGHEHMELGISVEEADANYELAGWVMLEDPPPFDLAALRLKHPTAFTPKSETALASVLEDLKLSFSLSSFQELMVNSLLNGLDTICVVPTGSGKTLIIYLYVLSLDKMRGNTAGGRKGTVVVGVPLTSIMLGQLDNQYCHVATLSMGAELRGSTWVTVGDAASLGSIEEGQPKITEEDILSGKFRIIFAHPEALETELGKRLLRNLRKKKMIEGVFIDEAHLGLDGHWQEFRPDLVEKVYLCVLYILNLIATT